MTDEVYYSALHWAKKAEASAKEAAESAATPGKIIQLGFDGVVENSILVFKHAPGGSEIPYSLVDDAEYEIDLNYASTGSLADNVQMRIKNGSDTINFVSAIHRSSTESATIGDMKAVMRFNSSTGYRWLFKAAFKTTPAGAKVFLLYPVIYNDEAVKALQTADAQNVKLTGNQTIAGTKTFTGVVTQQANSVQPIFKSTGYTKGTAPSGDIYMLHRIYRENGNNPVFDEYYYIPKTTNRPTYILRMQNVSSASATGYKDMVSAWYDGTNSQYSIQANVVNVPTPATTDNSTKAATTAWVNNVLSTLYPIGSVYMGTQSTCPLATLISGSKWEVVATNIVVSVDTNAPVKGTGMTLGLTDGTNNHGTYYATQGYGLMPTDKYGSNVGSGASTTTKFVNGVSVGVTTDSSKSGITATVTRTNLTINIWKRTA